MHEDLSDIKTRIKLLEVGQIDSTIKITTLSKGFDDLNVSLAKLTTAITTSVRTLLIAGTFIAAVIGGFWKWNIYTTESVRAEIINKVEQLNNQQVIDKLKE